MAQPSTNPQPVSVIYRPYQNSDYPQYEELVNQAWGFDQIFSPQAMADFAKLQYTKGALKMQ